MNVITLGPRGRAALGTLAILLITASMPAGAGVLPDEAKKVDELIDLYEEDKRGSGQPGRGVGWAVARLDVAEVGLSNLRDRGEIRAATGQIFTNVNTVSKQAELMFNPHEAFNDAVKPWNPTRRGLDSDPEQGTYRAVLSDPRAPDVEGLLGIGRYYVQSNRQGSYAELGSASGWMRAKRFGLVSDMGDKGLASAVTHEHAKATVGATIEDFQINLNDVFQQERVELPLGLTLNIATGASLPGGETAQKAWERLQLFEQRLGVLNALAEDLAVVQEELQPYLSAMPGYDKAEERVAGAEAALWAAKAAGVAAAESVVRLAAENEELNARIAAVNQVLSAVSRDIATLQRHIDDTTALVEAQKAKVEALRAEEAALTETVPDLTATPDPTATPAPTIGLLRYRAQRALIDVSTELAQAIAQLEALQQSLADAETGKAVLSAASADTKMELQDLRATLASGESALAAARDAKAQADRDIASLDAEYVDARQSMEDLQAAAANLSGTARRLAERAQAKKVDAGAVVFEVRSLAADLADLVPIYHKLTDSLQPWPLFKIRAITYELHTRLNDTETVADVRCGLEGVELLGEALEVRTCDDLRGLKPMIEEQLEEFLSTFTVERPEVRLTVPEGIVATVPVADGLKQVKTRLTPLRLVVEPFQLRRLTDPVMDAINTRIDTLQEQVSYADIRDLVRLQEAPRQTVDWVLNWNPGQQWSPPERADRDRIEMQAMGTGARYQVAGSDGDVEAAEGDLDRELDGVQDSGNQTAGQEVGGQGTSGVDASVGGLETDVMWAGCVDCDKQPVPTPTPTPPVPTSPPPCDAADPACADGTWQGIPQGGRNVRGEGSGGAGDGAGSGSGGGAGSGSDGHGSGADGVPVSDVVGDANLPTTGGRPALLLLGLVLLVAAGVLRRRPAMER